jgi:hypothetical protein
MAGVGCSLPNVVANDSAGVGQLRPFGVAAEISRERPFAPATEVAVVVEYTGAAPGQRSDFAVSVAGGAHAALDNAAAGR